MRQRYSFILVADCIHQNLTFKIQQSFPYVLLILLLSFSSANYIICLFKTFFLKYYHSFLCVNIIKTKWKSSIKKKKKKSSNNTVFMSPQESGVSQK